MMTDERRTVCHRLADEHARFVRRMTALNLYSTTPPDADETSWGAPVWPEVYAEHIELLRGRWDAAYRHACSVVAPWLDSFEVEDGEYRFTFKRGCVPVSADTLLRSLVQARMTRGILGSPRGDAYAECEHEAATALHCELCAAEQRGARGS